MAQSTNRATVETLSPLELKIEGLLLDQNINSQDAINCIVLQNRIC
jgi:hypothetical protein